MESVLDCLAQFSSKTCSKKSSTSLFWVYLAETKGCCGGSSRVGFGKSLIYQLFAQ